MPCTLDVTIVNWKSSGVLKACLESVLGSNREGYSLGRVTVVDNASGDDCAAVVARYGEVELIENRENRGFAAGCNLGVRNSEARYVLFLNPDVVVSRDAIDRVIRFLESPGAEHVGICGIRLFGSGGKETLCCSRFPTWRTMVAETVGLDRLAPGLFRSRDMEPGELRGSREVDQVIGAFFAVRRGVFEALGGFDEGFFVYFEEVDFAFRARQQGWRSYFLGEAEGTHIGRVSSDQGKSQRLVYFVESRLRYCRKHLGAGAYAVVLVLSITIEPMARLCRAVVGGSASTMGEVLEGYGRLMAAAVGWLWRRVQGRTESKAVSDGRA